MNKIPVFLHIPKNAGTYVLGWTMKLFRYYGISRGCNNVIDWNFNFRRILLQYDGFQIATVFAHDAYNIRKNNKSFIQHPTHEYCNIVDARSFLEELKNKRLDVFSIIIEDNGIKFLENSLYESICEFNNKCPLYYTLFRNPYDRAESLYNYLTSDKSLHEPTHNAIKAKSFIEYLNSYELEDSWLIRKLTQISNSDIIDERIFDKACSVLDVFNIRDIKYTDELFDNVFGECYGIDQSIVNSSDKDINKNSTVKKYKTSFDELDDITRDVFLERTRFDRKLYNKYCK
jgi:hypothetical protein